MAQPPVVAPDAAPDAQLEPASRVFRAVDPRAVPEIASVLEWLAAHEPDVLRAVADVDRSLIWAAMERSPLDFVEDCVAAIEELAALRDRAHRGGAT